MSNTPQPKPEDSPARLKDKVTALTEQNDILKTELQKRDVTIQEFMNKAKKDRAWDSLVEKAEARSKFFRDHNRLDTF